MTRLEIILGLITVWALSFGGWLLYHDHVEIDKGRQQIITSDAKALQAARNLAHVQTQANHDKAALAAQGTLDAQRAVDAYRTLHPLQPVFVCHPNDRKPAVPATGPAVAQAQGTHTGPNPDRAVPDGPGYDLRPGLAILVSVAQQLAITDAEWQRR